MLHPVLDLGVTKCPLTNLPAGLMLDRQLGVVHTTAVMVQAIGPYYSAAVLAPRAVKASNGDIFVMGVLGGYYQLSESPTMNQSFGGPGTKGARGTRVSDRGSRTPPSTIWCSSSILRNQSESMRLATHRRGKTHAASIVLRWSDDNGGTWSVPWSVTPVNDPSFPDAPVHMRGAIMPSGVWLWGAYYRGDGIVGDTQYLLRSADRGQTWTLLPRRHPDSWRDSMWGKFVEGIVVPTGGPLATLYLRAPGGHMYEARSLDDGMSWGIISKTPDLVHLDALPMVFPFAGGKRLIAFVHNRYDADQPHHNHLDRTELCFAVSDDSGGSCSAPRFVLA